MTTGLTAKAAVLYRTGEPLIVEDGIEIPPLADTQVLVKLAFSGLCHSQLMEVRGQRGKDRFLPHLLGHEGTGQVIAIGKSVRKVEPGNFVVLGWIKGEGGDAVGGTRYRKGDTVINAGSITTFGTYSVVSENRCVPLPEGVPLDVAVLFGCAIPTGAGIVFHEIDLKPEHTVAFFGLGGVGMSALMAARIFECRQVIAVDVEPGKLKLAGDFGATHLVNAAMEDPVAAVFRITEGRGVDFSIEAAGITRTIEQAFRSVRVRGGRCVFASHPRAGDTVRLDPFDLICGRQIAGSWGGSCSPDRDIPRFAELYRQGKLPLEKLLSDRYGLEGINQAIEDLERRRIVRALIEIDPGMITK